MDTNPIAEAKNSKPTLLKDLQPNALVRGILPDCLIKIVNVQWFGTDALEMTYWAVQPEPELPRRIPGTVQLDPARVEPDRRRGDCNVGDRGNASWWGYRPDRSDRYGEWPDV